MSCNPCQEVDPCGCADPCEESCGCDVKIESLTCITHDGLTLDCINVLPGDNLETIITKINTAVCAFGASAVTPVDGNDGVSIDHVSFTSTTDASGTAGVAGATDTYTQWADVAETTPLGTFVVLNGATGLAGTGVDHTSFTSSSLGGAASQAGATDTYTIWADALETSAIGTFTLLNGTGVDHSSFTSTTSASGLAGDLDGVDTYTLWKEAAETNSLGTYVVKQAENLTNNLYDSDWIDIPTYGANAWGLPIFTNGVASPKFRVVGKTVFVEGHLIVPMGSDAAGLTLLSDATDYVLAYNDLAFVYQGTDGGYLKAGILGAEGILQSHSPLLPPALYPTESVQVEKHQIITRLLKSKAGNNITLTTVVPSIEFRATGQVRITGLTEAEGLGAIATSPFYQGLVTNVETNQLAPVYTNYNSSYSGAVDNRVSPVSTVEYPLNFNGRYVENFGGMEIPFSFSYPLGSTVTQAQIEAAIASL